MRLLDTGKAWWASPSHVHHRLNTQHHPRRQMPANCDFFFQDRRPVIYNMLKYVVFHRAKYDHWRPMILREVL